MNTSHRHSHNFVGAAGAYGRFLKANVDTTLFNPFGTDTYASVMQELGKVDTASSLKGKYHEDTDSNVPVIGSCSASASAGAATTFTVAAASVSTYGSVDPYTASNDVDVVLPQKGDQIGFANGVIGTVLTVPNASHEFDIAANDPTKVIPATTTSDEVINMGQRTEEGSGSPDAISSLPTEFEWQMNFKKRTFELTDVGSTESVYIKQKDGSYVWGIRDYEKTLEGLNVQHSAEMLVGEQITNPVVLNTLKEAPTGSGYLPYVKTNGNNIGYSGSLAKANWDSWALSMAGIRGPKSHAVIGGMQQILDSEEELKDLSGDTAFAMFKNGKKMSLNLQFEDFHFGNYDIYIKHFNEFDHEGMLGAKNFTYKDLAFVMPMKNAGTKPEDDYICMLNFEKEAGPNAGGSRMGYEEKVMLGTGGNNDIEESIDKYIVTIRKALKVKGQRNHTRFYKQ